MFERPTQVVFIDPNDGQTMAGIAYGDEIICGCCGGIFEVAEVEHIFQYDNWVELTDTIIGGEYPENYRKFLDERD